MGERAVADHEMPRVSAVLRRKRLGDRLQRGVVGDVLGRALEHDVEAAFAQLAAAGREDARGVVRQVSRLALL
jgi:hypothetical protein